MAQNETDTAFVGSIPEQYDRFLGPLFFVPYAQDVAARARAIGPRRILEIAAGTGIVTRALADALPEAHIEATDLNEAMIALARARSTAPGVRWSTADAMALPFDDARFDLAVCQFGVMFFPDRARAYREARRVLAPEGTYLLSVWDEIAHNDVAQIVSQAAATVLPDDPPQFLRRTPHGYADPAAIEGELRAAGFTRIAWERVPKRSRGITVREAALGLVEGSPLRNEIAARGRDRLPEVLEAATRALREAFGGDAVDGAMCAYVFTAS
ncbi:MAG TPA: methyltransferase domain-containing protein [Candidatus Limnocylindria bacterium]|nr:methyltransferase domain-containing protein [Candidatus Limnocylindria bacterium]